MSCTRTICPCCDTAVALSILDASQPALLVMCKACGHFMLYDGIELRNLNAAELLLPSNTHRLKEAREMQEVYCMKQGWWG